MQIFTPNFPSTYLSEGTLQADVKDKKRKTKESCDFFVKIAQESRQRFIKHSMHWNYDVEHLLLCCYQHIFELTKDFNDVFFFRNEIA